MSEIFKFSIIISLFESQSYLEETIESIVNQTLNFKENIQIIFVDNESQDRSLLVGSPCSPRDSQESSRRRERGWRKGETAERKQGKQFAY